MSFNQNLLRLLLLQLVISLFAMETTGQKLSRSEPVRFLALGDSYTIGEGVAETQRWPAQLVNALMLQGYSCHQPEIVAVTGWRTDDLKRALNERKFSGVFNLVSLMIGVNNQYQKGEPAVYEKEFEALLLMAIDYAGRNPASVLVLSIPDYGYTPFGLARQSEISPQIDAFNKINKAVAEKYGVAYVDVTDISRNGLNDPGLIAEDGLHPSAKMYGLWVQRILESIDP